MISNFRDIFNVDEELAPCIGGALIAEGIGLQPVYRRDTTDLASPYVNVEVKQGESFPNRVHIINRTQYPEMWEVTIHATITTFRDNTEMEHKAIKALIRRAIHEFKRTLSTDNSPDYQIENVRETGTDYAYDSSNKTDTTTINFAALALVRPEVWQRLTP